TSSRCPSGEADPRRKRLPREGTPGGAQRVRSAWSGSSVATSGRGRCDVVRTAAARRDAPRCPASTFGLERIFRGVGAGRRGGLRGGGGGACGTRGGAGDGRWGA